MFGRSIKNHLRNRPLRIESLENRSLMAGDIVASFNDGVLRVEGTSGDDAIEIAEYGEFISVGGTDLRVQRSEVNKIKVCGRGGDDVISVDVQPTANGSSAEGETGTDGATQDLKVKIHGGEGNDNIKGSALADVIFGGYGDDVIDGRAGSDFVVGGAGDDICAGGDGDDVLQGEAGVDQLNGGAGENVMQGGAGVDVKTFDLVDSPTSVIPRPNAREPGGEKAAGDEEEVRTFADYQYADLDGDGKIDNGDLALFSKYFLTDTGNEPDATIADFDKDGVVDLGDFDLFREAAEWQTTVVDRSSPTDVRDAVTTVVPKAIADMTARFNLPPDSIRVVSVEATMWSDTSLGLPEPDQVYAQVIVPGFKIQLEGLQPEGSSIEAVYHASTTDVKFSHQLTRGAAA